MFRKYCFSLFEVIKIFLIFLILMLITFLMITETYTLLVEYNNSEKFSCMINLY